MLLPIYGFKIKKKKTIDILFYLFTFSAIKTYFKINHSREKLERWFLSVFVHFQCMFTLLIQYVFVDIMFDNWSCVVQLF